MSDDAAALPAGCRISDYEIQRTLGGGGFGLTYLARDNNLDLTVAVKEYFPADMAQRNPDNSVQVRSGDDDVRATYEWGLERFLDEARALATFRHPNIVRVLRYFRENGTAYIVMEYESGQPLKRWVPANAPLSQKALLSIVYPLLDGLEQVHQAGFLHRDIKPDNIYVRADGGPVLLDFGSARRVQTNRDMTNIVSPGFAPFEQYHSQGHQGPWTDIYSIGAVMYWMVTGKKPLESASRVKTDGMVPASDLAESRVFGEPLLRAIEWAMSPEESRRPQTVAEFREAIRGSEQAGFDSTQRTSRTTVTAAAGHAQSGAPSGASGPSQKRNLLGTILFLDLVGYSIKSVDDQVRLKKLFNELIAKALRGVPEDSRIAIDTGDGAAICFMGDPEEALHSALLLRDLLGQRYGTQLSARIGLHMGPVRVIADINDRVNVIGDGINVAQRVMDFAQPNQVLVSRAYYDVISRITDDTAEMFVYLGEYEDKHGRPHEVYSVEPARRDAARDGATAVPTQTIPAGRPITDEQLHEIESELARHIGPLARVLLKKAFPLATGVEALREALAPSIQDPKARELFLIGAGGGPSQPPGSASMPLLSKPLSVPFSRPRSGPPTAPSRPSVPGGNTARAQPLSQPMSRPGAVTRVAVDLAPEEQAALEAALSKCIGPLAKMIVKKELGRARGLKEFINALCENVDNLEQRDAFLEAARRIFKKRGF